MARDPSERPTPPGRPAAGTIFYLLFGPIVWSLHFLAIYGPQSLLCARGLPEAVGPTLMGATLVCGLALLAAILAPERLARLMKAAHWPAERQAFLDTVMRALAGLSLFAVLAGGAGGLILPACPGLR
ncbi:MAG: hypothetical protein WD341_03445 [Tistlia sp.]|uniref:hypothetical protein n=1 Tax=Tistlia sp. TaxID=3057121 RepID=UPI0034A48E71